MNFTSKTEKNHYNSPQRLILKMTYWIWILGWVSEYCALCIHFERAQQLLLISTTSVIADCLEHDNRFCSENFGRKSIRFAIHILCGWKVLGTAQQMSHLNYVFCVWLRLDAGGCIKRLKRLVESFYIYIVNSTRKYFYLLSHFKDYARGKSRMEWEAVHSLHSSAAIVEMVRQKGWS